MSVKDIKIEPTEDINLLRVRVQDAINSLAKDINLAKQTTSLSLNNQRITDVGNPSQLKDAVNLETLQKVIHKVRTEPVSRPTTPFRPIVQRLALTFGINGTVTTGDDLTPRVEAHIPSLYQMEAHDAWVNSKVAVTGDSTWDVEYSTNSGTSWVSIFGSGNLLTLGSGHTQLSPAKTTFVSHPTIVQRGWIFRVNCDAAGGAEDVEVVVRWNLIRKPPTLDRRDDLE